MATATRLTRDMTDLGLALAELRKATPSTGQVHVDRPLEDKKDDPADGELNPDPVEPGLEDGVQDPFDYRNMDEGHMPREGKADKDDDDPGTQDVDPPNQSAVDIAPLDVIVPQTIMKTISGSSPISLNAEGVKLANKLAERIAAKGCLDIMYSSTLPRGVETVQPILAACPHCVYAEATSGLVPWKLGAFEGEEPKVVGKQIAWYIDHPDEVPPGEGNDGEPGESFNASKTRQLGFFKKVMQDWRDDPTMKIGVQVHSRGEDLFVAWVADGAPDDYDVDTKDVIDPDDQPHASVMRWAGKDGVKEVDLDGDDMLKSGVYLVLHSLTDDDGDDGNPELEKYEGQARDDNGKFGAGAKLGALQDMHDKLKDHAGRSPNPSHVAEENFQHGVTMLGDKARELAAHPAFNVKINRSGDKARGVILNHVKLGDNMRQSATASDKAWHTDLALSHYHDALLTAGRVLGSKWVGKSAAHVGPARVYMPPIEVHRAAKSAWDAGASVIGITEALADSSGLDLAHVQAVADFFAASESATASPTTRNAYGGVNAAKWAAKVISKSAKEWEPWVGVDLDGTLCLPLESYSGTAIGAPIKPMVAKVKALLAKGVKVRIFTARVADDADGRKAKAVRSWCVDVLGQALPVTNEKDPGMTELWDDRARNPDDVAKAGSGVMVAFMLDQATAEKLAVPGGEDPEDMHVTLAYLGKPGAVDMGRMPALGEAVKAYAAQHAPVAGTLDGPVRFSAKPQTEGRDVAVAAFCNPGIQEFRAGLVDAIKAVGVDVPRAFDYRPHVCVKYIPADADMPVQRIAPTAVTFDAVTLSVGGVRKSYPLSGTVVKYDPDQPRAADGEWGSGGARPKVNARVERARKSFVLIGTKEQKIADETERKLSDALGVPRTADNSAFDLRNDDVGIEVKTLLVGAHEKITMCKSALARKVAEQRDDDLRGYTVVADMRGGRERATYYYKEGFGSFRLGSMTKVSLSELRGVVR